MPDLTMPKFAGVVQPPAPTAAQPDPTIPVEQPAEPVAPVVVVKPQVAAKGDVEPKPFDEDRTDTDTYTVVQVQGNLPAFKWQGTCKQCPFMAREADKASALGVVIAHVSNKHGV